MSPGISKSALNDAEIVDAEELASTGLVTYLEGVQVASTWALTKTVTLADYYVHTPDAQVEVGDLVTLAGGAAGSYTIASLTGQYTFTVVEAIPDSTGGTAAFTHPAGASKVGVDPSLLSWSTREKVQDVLEDLDAAITSGGADNGLLIFTTGGGMVYDNSGNVLHKRVA